MVEPNQKAGSSPLAPQGLRDLILVSEAEGGATVRHIPIACSPFLVGRRRSVSLCLPFPNVSKEHAEIFRGPESWMVRDLGSTNGTFLNGQRIVREEPIREGSVLHFADQEFRVRNSSPSHNLAARLEEASPWIQAACQFDKLFDDGTAVPYFQPIVSLADGGLLGYEVLARSMLEGLQGAGEMFGIAARLKQQGELSRLFRTLGVTVGQTLPGSPILFLNTHPFELDDPKLLMSLRKLRSESPAQPLALEIHESAVTNPRLMRELRSELDKLDIRLAYDDFGAGQDRLLDLTEVPPDYVKFDARLIRDIHLAAPARQRMVEVLVKLVRDMKIAPLAECVESAAESDACRSLGFEYAQGFYFGRPAPLADHRLGIKCPQDSK